MIKKHIRQQMRAQRHAVSHNQRQSAAHALASAFIDHPLLQRSQNLAFYLPIGTEFDPTPLKQQAIRLGKTCYLPALSPANPNELCFIEDEGDDDSYIINRLGIYEPKYNQNKLILAKDLDLVFVPLLAFDQHGFRLGMGAGFYDRSFAFIKDLSSQQHRPYLVGLAYDFQTVETLPRDPWDVPLDAIATESGVKQWR